MSQKPPRNRRLWIAIIAFVVIAILAALLMPGGPLATQVASSLQRPADTPAPTSTQVLPAAPSHLTGDVVAVFDVPVGWQDNSNNEDGFVVYRQRIDLLGAKTKAGQTGRDMTRLLDDGTACGETYQYTVASFNTAGESPATDCWQITLPACPAPETGSIDAGNKTQPGDFYLGADSKSFLADQPGQNGLVDLGDIGETPLDHVALPNPPAWVKDGVAATAGHTYAALMKDGQSVMVFTVKSLTSARAEIASIVWQPGKTSTGVCQPLDETVAGGNSTPGVPTLAPCSPTDPNCLTPVTMAPCSSTDPNCTTPTKVPTIAPCPQGDPLCSSTPTPTWVPCTAGAATAGCGQPTEVVTQPPCTAGVASPNCPQPTEVVTEPPAMCSAGWAPSADQGCVCCGSDQICPGGGITANAKVCGGGDKPCKKGPTGACQ